MAENKFLFDRLQLFPFFFMITLTQVTVEDIVEDCFVTRKDLDALHAHIIAYCECLHKRLVLSYATYVL